MYGSEKKASVSWVFCGPERESGTRKGVSDQAFEIQYGGVSSLNELHSAFHFPLHNIGGDSENKWPASKVVCGAVQESGTRKDVSG